MKLKNQGFSLVSVMVAAGVGLIIMTAITQQMVNQTRTVRYLEAKMESLNLKQELTLLLSNDASCDLALDNLNLNTAGLAGGDYTEDITTQINTGSMLLTNLKNSYSNNRLINLTSVSLFKPGTKLNTTPNTSSPYEFKVKMTVQETGALGRTMIVDGPMVVLNVTGSTIDAPDACFQPPSGGADIIYTGVSFQNTWSYFCPAGNVMIWVSGQYGAGGGFCNIPNPVPLGAAGVSFFCYGGCGDPAPGFAKSCVGRYKCQ